MAAHGIVNASWVMVFYYRTVFFVLQIGTIHLRRRHVLGGEGGSPLPMFADARGAGVLGLPTSAIFESIRPNLHI